MVYLQLFFSVCLASVLKQKEGLSLVLKELVIESYSNCMEIATQQFTPKES